MDFDYLALHYVLLILTRAHEAEKEDTINDKASQLVAVLGDAEYLVLSKPQKLLANFSC